MNPTISWFCTAIIVVHVTFLSLIGLLHHLHYPQNDISSKYTSKLKVATRPEIKSSGNFKGTQDEIVTEYQLHLLKHHYRRNLIRKRLNLVAVGRVSINIARTLKKFSGTIPWESSCSFQTNQNHFWLLIKSTLIYPHFKVSGNPFWNPACTSDI